VREAGLEERIGLRAGLAEELSAPSFGVESFDHAIFSYSLSMIPDWQGALVAAHGALSRHGRLHVVDFADFKGGLLGARGLDGVADILPCRPSNGISRYTGRR
jgi:S-adenosylmethionine-diacylgycerolhomoserine-N-methlytransferase